MSSFPNMIPTTGRTFLRNLKPHSYPTGTRVGTDWQAKGGIFDNSDPRSWVYWGPPRPVKNDLTFGPKPGETPEQCVSRLKRDGYIGLYSLRQTADRQRLSPDIASPGPSSLDRIAAAVGDMAARRTPTILTQPDGSTRRATRAEEKLHRQAASREAFLGTGATGGVPTLGDYDSAGIGEERDDVEPPYPLDIPEIPETPIQREPDMDLSILDRGGEGDTYSDEVEAQATANALFAQSLSPEGDGILTAYLVNTIVYLVERIQQEQPDNLERLESFLAARLPKKEAPQTYKLPGTQADSMEQIIAALALRDRTDGIPTDDFADSLDGEDEDSPIGGGGKAASQLIPIPPPVIVKPVGGKGIAGGGARKKTKDVAAAPA